MKNPLASITYPLRKALSPLTFRGLKVPTTGGHVSRGVWKAVYRGTYELPEIEALFGLLKPTDRLLELGTGMGVVSGVAARAHPQLQVISYEANPAMIPVIAELHRLNGITNVQVNNAVLTRTSTPGTRDFYLKQSFAVGSLLSTGKDGQKSVRVAENPLEDVLADFCPDVLLCDIEGGEAELFPGLDLSGLRAVIMEIHPGVIDRASEAAIYDALAASGLYPRVELGSGTVVAFESVRSKR